MLDIKFVRDNPDAVRENIKKKFQDAKLPLVDEVLELDAKNRAAITISRLSLSVRARRWMPWIFSTLNVWRIES